MYMYALSHTRRITQQRRLWTGHAVEAHLRPAAAMINVCGAIAPLSLHTKRGKGGKGEGCDGSPFESLERAEGRRGGGGRLLGANAGDGKSVAAAAHVQVLENWK